MKKLIAFNEALNQKLRDEKAKKKIQESNNTNRR